VITPLKKGRHGSRPTWLVPEQENRPCRFQAERIDLYYIVSM